MKAPQGLVQSYCNHLEHLQRKLCLKDNGTNTEEIHFLLRCLEQTRVEMLSAKDSSTALDIHFSLWQDQTIARLLKKYGLEL